jgi:hypothetical protein
MKLFGGFVHGVDNNAVIALADYPGVDIKGGLSPSNWKGRKRRPIQHLS